MKQLLYKLFIKPNDATAVQLFRYFFVGGTAAMVNIGTFAICTEMLGIYYLIGNIFGFGTGLITNYFLCKYFVFTNRMSITRASEFALHGFISIISLGIDTSVLWICTQHFGLYPFMSKIIATATGFLWNFSGRKAIYMILKQTEN